MTEEKINPEGKEEFLPKIAGHLTLDNVKISVPSIPDSEGEMPHILLDVSVNLGSDVHCYTPYLYDTTLTPISQVANQVRRVPREFISADGMGVTASFERYARPLIEGEVSSTYQGGVPHHITPLDADRA